MFLRNWARLYSKQTPAEVVFEEHLCKLGVPYRTQHPFFGLRRIVDFVLPREKVVIEVDGASHAVPAQKRKDLISSIALEELGFAVIRFTNDELLNGLVVDRDLLDARIAARPTPRQLRRALAEFADLGATRARTTTPRKRSPKPDQRSQSRKARKHVQCPPSTPCL